MCPQWLIICLQIGFIHAQLSYNQSNEIVNFLKDNGKKSVNIIENGQLGSIHFVQDLFDNFVTRQIKTEDFITELDFEFDCNIFFTDFGHLNETLHLIASTKVQSSLIVFDNIFDEVAWQELEDTLSNLKRNSYFFIAVNDGDESLEWKFVITLNNETQVVINQLKFKSESMCIDYEFNLQV